jgi:hypothetical protein
MTKIQNEKTGGGHSADDRKVLVIGISDLDIVGNLGFGA